MIKKKKLERKEERERKSGGTERRQIQGRCFHHDKQSETKTMSWYSRNQNKVYIFMHVHKATNCASEKENTKNKKKTQWRTKKVSLNISSNLARHLLHNINITTVKIL